MQNLKRNRPTLFDEWGKVEEVLDKDQEPKKKKKKKKSKKHDDEI